MTFSVPSPSSRPLLDFAGVGILKPQNRFHENPLIALQSEFITYIRGGSFLLTAGAFSLSVRLLCLQSLKALIRRTFPLQAKNSNCREAPVRFGSVTVWEGNGSSGSGFRF